MRVRESFTPQPAGTASFPSWLQVVYHPPTPGNVYTVKHRLDGTPFQAWLSYDHRWFHVLPDANGDGTRELGELVRETLDLYYVARI